MLETQISCPFLDGVNSFQCFSARSLPVARTAIGYDGMPLSEVRKDLCQSTNENRGELCPILKELREIGTKSQYARPVRNSY